MKAYCMSLVSNDDIIPHDNLYADSGLVRFSSLRYAEPEPE